MADIRIYYSVMKNVEVIGEAASMLTRHFREAYQETPWRQIVGMRNVLVHGYAQVTDADLWLTATTDVRPLRERVQHYLDDIDWEQWAACEDPYTEMDNAIYKKMEETARKMKAKGFAVPDIAEVTGLTREEIARL